MAHKPIVVMIRDGWGFREQAEANGPVKANTPFTDEMMEKYPKVLIDASGEAVGLPDGYMGNSEVGHMTIGSGRIIYQAMVRINKEIESGSFFENKAFLDVISHCKAKNMPLHLIGLVQIAGVHAHLNHLLALLDLCKKQDFSNVLVHVISDGRDSQVQDTVKHTETLISKMNELGVGKIATISGRYYAMDRDKRWDRTKKAYDAIVKAESEATFGDPIKAFNDSYSKDVTDEFIIPMHADWYKGIEADHGVIFFNFRTDRTRQLTKALIEDEFEGWERSPIDVKFVAMTDFYNPMSSRAVVAYTPQSLKNLLGDAVADAGLRQLRISETEKYAHVTFFFNGQVEEPKKNEDRVLINSPKVATYDLKPEMSVYELCDRLCEEIDKDIYDMIVVNFVNGDMVGHTGVWEAVVKACEAVDACVEKACKKILEKDGVALVFADHGNCEEMEGMYKTSHTINPVHLLVVSNDPALQKGTLELPTGKGLKDIAPTALKLLGVEKPDEMSGESMI
ncbi:2,3-bisphosphoglycerate-independent phosphoglycerate mutase [Candidatus Woesearchaeota archaeon]|nr:2,3-bisphosphoglycerate-independent phosphoglycerate mutase [Candidatus Woesearchaeota archaeon]